MRFARLRRNDVAGGPIPNKTYYFQSAVIIPEQEAAEINEGIAEENQGGSHTHWPDPVHPLSSASRLMVTCSEERKVGRPRKS